MKLGCGLLFVLILCGGAANAQTTFYVSKEGDDLNPCSEKLPCFRIGHGVQLLGPGDTLIIKGGKYKESLNDLIPGGSSWSQPVTVKANPGDTVVLRPKPGQEATRVLYFAYPIRQYIIVDGLTIDARNVKAEAVKITSGAHHIRIQNCEILKASTMGVLITDPSSTNNEIINCQLHDIGGSAQFDHAVYISTGNNLVEGCRIYDTLSHGIHVYGHTGMDRNVFRGNTIYNCKRGIGLYGGSKNLICNNVIYDQMEYGILLRNDAGDLDSTMVYNNTIAKAGSFGIYNQSTAASTLIRNNIVIDNDKDIGDLPGTAILGRNLAGVDPKFVDLAARDLHLKAGSPAIDAGEKIDEVSTDRDGVRRPQGRGYDLGAYEFVGASGGSAVSNDATEISQPLKFDSLYVLALGWVLCGFGALLSYRQLRARQQH